MKSEFAVRMALLRQEKGLSQREAATSLGISQALLSHYENGAREPRFEFVLTVCDFFNVTADYLLGRVDERVSEAEILRGKVSEIVASLEETRDKENELIGKLAKLAPADKK